VKPWMDPSEEPFGADPPWQEDIYLPPRRRRMGAWIVACMLSLSLALVGWAAEKRYHVVALVKDRLAGRAVPSLEARVEPRVEARTDPRVDALLADGERALTEGKLDGAQGDFDKASVLTERDPRVLLGEARVAVAKADVLWLKQRLLAPGASEDARVTKVQLDALVATARQAADDALSVAPSDVAAMRTKLDSLRLAGDADGARAYVTGVAPQASQPDTAYSLAALNLLQVSSPSFPVATTVAGLRTAADAEGGAGRARAALVYVLGKSGDVAQARAELAKLDAQTPPYPVLPNLHAWLGLGATVASPPPVEALVQAPAQAPAVAPPAPAPSEPPAAAPQPRAPVAAATLSGADTTAQAAADAVRRGDYDRAERIYQGIVAMHPRDSQAMSALGDVRRVHNDPWGAIETYQRAIEINPSYMPALLGLADTQWARGDHEGASHSYKRIVDRFPQAMYPDYVTQRAAP
jgi:tetratricopeptide (TPR) repeat protein